MTDPAIIRRRLAAALATLLLGAACTPDTPPPAGLADPATLLWAVRLDHHAVTLASSGPASTIQLSSVAMNPSGAALAGATVVYSLSDSENLSVDGKGLVAARGVANGVRVIAMSTVGNVTKQDTAYVNVVDAPPSPGLASLTLSLGSGGTSVPAVGAFGFFGTDQALVTATDSAGGEIDGLPIYYTSSDPTTLTVDPVQGNVTGIRPGSATLTATTTAFGVTETNAITVTVVGPQLGAVAVLTETPLNSDKVILAFSPGDLKVSVGASVAWLNASYSMPIDVVFDDSVDVAESPIFPFGAGNIPAFMVDTINGIPGFRFRAFPKAGTYTYHSALYGTNGRIIVE